MVHFLRPALFLCITLNACDSGKSASSRQEPPENVTSPTMSATPTAPPPARLTHVTAAYGGSGPAPPNHVSIVLLFDLEATSAIAALRVASIEVLDASGSTRARSLAPVGRRVAPLGRTNLDYSEQGTAPLTGPIAAGTKLRLRAAADLSPLKGASRQLRYRATFTPGDSTTPLVLEGPMDNPWPSAGPAGPPAK